MNVLKRYLGFFVAIAKISLISDLEYRANFVGKILADLVWYSAQLSLFEVLFKHSSLIGGWTLAELRVFMGVLFFVDAFYMIFFHENLDNFSSKIVKGELDLTLAKPVNSQFMMSLGRVNSPYFVNILLIVSYLFWSVSKLPVTPGIGTILCWLVTCFGGLVVMYTIRFAFVSTAILFTKAEAMHQVWYQIYRLATRPDAVYPIWLRVFVFTLLPIGFVTSIPARVLLGKDFPGITVISVLVASALLYLSHRWWQYVLSKYSSASS